MKIRGGRERRTRSEWRATLPTVWFGKTIEMFDHIMVFFDGGAARGRVARQNGESHFRLPRREPEGRKLLAFSVVDAAL